MKSKYKECQRLKSQKIKLKKRKKKNNEARVNLVESS